MIEPTASRVAWAGDYLRVEVETWPGIGDYEVIHKHDAVAIVPVTPDGDVVLVRQFRPPVRDSLLEVPAGLLDIEGEDARTCAERELYEETGYRSAGAAFLGGTYLSPGFTDEYMHLFWAWTGAEPEGALRGRHRGGAPAAARGGGVGPDGEGAQCDVGPRAVVGRCRARLAGRGSIPAVGWRNGGP